MKPWHSASPFSCRIIEKWLLTTFLAAFLAFTQFIGAGCWRLAVAPRRAINFKRFKKQLIPNETADGNLGKLVRGDALGPVELRDRQEFAGRLVISSLVPGRIRIHGISRKRMGSRACPSSF